MKLKLSYKQDERENIWFNLSSCFVCPYDHIDKAAQENRLEIFDEHPEYETKKECILQYISYPSKIRILLETNTYLVILNL